MEEGAQQACGCLSGGKQRGVGEGTSAPVPAGGALGSGAPRCPLIATGDLREQQGRGHLDAGQQEEVLVQPAVVDAPWGEERLALGRAGPP